MARLVTNVNKGWNCTVAGVILDKDEVEQLISDLKDVLQILNQPRPL